MATPLRLPNRSSNQPTRLSAACQQIHLEHLPSQLRRPSNITGSTAAAAAARIIIRSTLSDPQLWPVVDEHKCNGISLTPSGLYADMAVTVAQYIWHRYRCPTRSGDCEQSSEDRNDGVEKTVEGVKRDDTKDEEREKKQDAYPGFKVFDLDVTKPLIVTVPQPAEGQWIEMETLVTFPTSISEDDAQSQANAANAEAIDPVVDISDAVLHSKFRSITATGTALAELAHCSLRYEDWQKWLHAWSDVTPAVMSRITHLHSRALTESGAVTTIRQIFRDRAYELFRSFVDYTGPYRNMAEVVFDTETLEATSTVDYVEELNEEQEEPGVGGLGGPFWLDGSCHVSGFVCNAVEPDRERNAYISHGIDSMRIAPVFDPRGGSNDKKSGAGGGDIRNYVRMERSRADKSVLEGDVYIVQDGRVVGLWEGVKFKKIPRRVLNVFLPPPPGTATTTSNKGSKKS